MVVMVHHHSVAGTEHGPEHHAATAGNLALVRLPPAAGGSSQTMVNCKGRTPPALGSCVRPSAGGPAADRAEAERTLLQKMRWEIQGVRAPGTGLQLLQHQSPSAVVC